MIAALAGLVGLLTGVAITCAYVTCRDHLPRVPRAASAAERCGALGRAAAPRASSSRRPMPTRRPW